MSEEGLSKKFVEGDLAPGVYRDDKLSGFCLKVTPAGRKVYQVRKRVRGQEDKITVTIGVHGVITATVARERAKEIIGLMATGVNPNEIDRQKKLVIEEQRQAKELEQQTQEVTLENTLADYLQTRDLKAGSKYNYNCVVNAYLKDWLRLEMPDITKEMVLRRYQLITEDKGVGAANNTMRVLRALFTFATHRYEVAGNAVVTENPVAYLSRLKAWQKLPRRQTVLTVHQLKPWYEAVMALEDSSRSDLFRFLLFTGLRKGEAMSLKWKDVDLDAGTILITDTKNRQPHMLPLSDFLLELLEERQAVGGDYVFPSEQGGRQSDPRVQVAEVCTKTGITFTPHDLRRTFATVAESRALSWKTVKALLNHKMEDDVTAGYVVSEAERLRSAMQIISDTLKVYCGIDKSPKKAAAKKKRNPKVVEISSARKPG